MSPLAFKPNNLQLMRRTTLPDTAFERTDNFLSNECIHTLFSFQIVSSQAANQKLSGFCVFRFQADFDEREHFVLSSLYRNLAFIVICELRTRHPGPTRASIIFSSHWRLCSKRPPRLAMHPLKVVCHLPTNSHDIFPRIGSHCFHLWTQPKCCPNLK